MFILIGVLLLWMSIVAIMWRWQERLIFFPQPISHDTDAAWQDWQVEIITDDGTILRGWRRPGVESNDALLIYFGGNGEEVSWHMIDHGQRYQCEQWYINYRGYGNSEGTPSEAALQADALRIFDYATKHSGKQTVYVIGRSLGSHMAAYVAAYRPVKKLIMITPFDSVLNVARQHYKFFVIESLLRHPFNTLAIVDRITVPTLFLIAESDNIVPRANSENLINHWQAPQTTIYLPSTTHNKIYTPSFWRAINLFIETEEHVAV